MQGVTPRVALVAVLVAVSSLLSACGGSSQEVDSSMQTKISTPFKVTSDDDTVLLVGHGVVITLPRAWGTYEKEFTHATTWEYAVGEPASTTPFPAGLQLSMGMPNKGGQYDEGLPKSARDLASLTPGYRLESRGKAEVSGAKAASYFRFVSELDYQGASLPADQVTLIVKMSENVTSTIRFIAPEGQFDSTMKAVYDSVRVAVDDG